MVRSTREWLLTPGLRAELQHLASAGNSVSLAERARIVLLSAEGRTAEEISLELSVVPLTVYKWRKRFRALGIEGLCDLPRPGQPRKITEERREAILRATREEVPPGATRWSIRRVADAVGASEYQVRRVWEESRVAEGNLSLTAIQHQFRRVAELEVCGVFITPPHCIVALSVGEAPSPEASRVSHKAPGAAKRMKVQRSNPPSFLRAYELLQGTSTGGCSSQHLADFLSDTMRTRGADEEVHVVCCEHSREHLTELGAFAISKVHWLPSVSLLLSMLEDLSQLIEVRSYAKATDSPILELRAAIQSFVRTREVRQHGSEPVGFTWIRSLAASAKLSDWRELSSKRNPKLPVPGARAWHSCTPREVGNTWRAHG